MITGQSVHTGPTAHAILAKRAAGAGSGAIRPSPALGREIAAVIEQALAVEPRNRFATARDLQDALERASAAVVQPETPAPASPDPPRRVPSVAWAALAVVALAVVALAVVAPAALALSFIL
jgi:hypothetical protein